MKEVERFPVMHDLWEHKIPAFDQITVPAYVVASYSNTLHTAGTFRAWRRMASEDKWLRIHNTQEWPDYYNHSNVEDLRKFFDRYLKDEDNDWQQTPRVRYSVLDLHGGDRVAVPADRFPPSDVTSTRYYLDGRSRALVPAAPTDEVPAGYQAGSNPDAVSFIMRFEHETVLVGYPKARLWVEARGADDMDLFVLIQKLDAYGTPLQQFTSPNQSAMAHDITECGATILRYKGSDGRLRVSARHLDDALSTDDVPAHSFDRVEKLSPGEVVGHRDRPAPDRSGLPPRRTVALRHQLPEPPGSDDAQGPRVHPRQQRAEHHPHRRRTRLLRPTARTDRAVTRPWPARVNQPRTGP